jgi:hypothetical protein
VQTYVAAHRRIATSYLLWLAAFTTIVVLMWLLATPRSNATTEDVPAATTSSAPVRSQLRI